MCVLAFAWQAHPRWRLVAAGNRDELHARSAAPLARWETARHLIAGRDLQSGGAWLGVSEQGRFAVVTNLRGLGPPESGRASRGALVTDLLAGSGRYARPLEAMLPEFNPFNLIWVEGKRAMFLSNRAEPRQAILAPGIHGLSNSALDEPWLKTVQLKQALSAWLAGGDADPARLLDGLRSECLPREAPEQPDASHDPALSPIFIRHPVYGTRCSTVVAIDHEGRGLIVERRYSADTEVTGETALRFFWPSPAGVAS